VPCSSDWNRGAAVVVVDMAEQGPTRPPRRLIAHLRRRGPGARPLFLLTRSLRDPGSGRSGCRRGDHFLSRQSQPPISVAPYPGAPGYERLPLVWPRPKCGRGRKASSRGDPKWREAASRTKRTFSNDRSC